MTTTNYATDDFTDEDDEAREAREARAALITNLRAYTDLLEQHPDLPLPGSLYLTTYCTAAEARAARRGIPNWRKTNSKGAYYVGYSKTIGSGHDYRSDVHVSLQVGKEETCTRVQTGVQHVEAQFTEAHDEPVYEWRCGSGPGDDDGME